MNLQKQGKHLLVKYLLCQDCGYLVRLKEEICNENKKQHEAIHAWVLIVSNSQKSKGQH